MKPHWTLCAMLLLAAGRAAAQVVTPMPPQPPSASSGTFQAAPPAGVFQTTGPAAGSGVGVVPSSATNVPIAPPMPAYGFSAPGAPFGVTPSTVATAPVYPFQNSGVPYNQPAAPGQAAPPPSLSTAPPAGVPQAAPGTVLPRQSQARADARRAAKEIERSLKDLEKENDQRAHLLHEQFAKRREMLLDSEPWRYASRAERKSQLKALKSEFKQREAWLKQDYRRRIEVLIKDGGAGDLGQNRTY